MTTRPRRRIGSTDRRATPGRIDLRLRRLALQVALALVLGSGAATLASATPSTDFSFFGADAVVIEFDEIAMPQSTVVTNQYAGSGVTFTPNVWFENHRAPIGWDGANIANFQTGTTTVNPSVDFVFSGNVDGAAFEWAANGGNTFLLEADLGGSVDESLTHTQAGCCAAQVLGFENVVFDTLRVTHQSGGSQFFIADRLTFHLVPEPGTALLLGLGLALLPGATSRL